MDLQAIKPDLMVHAKSSAAMGGVPGTHVATVDHLDGNLWIKLKKSDSPDGKHHWIPTNWVERVDTKAVYLNKTPEEFSQGLLDESPIEEQNKRSAVNKATIQ